MATSPSQNKSKSSNNARVSVQRAQEPPRNAKGEIICNHEECEADPPTFHRRFEWNKHMDKHERPYKCTESGCEESSGFTYFGGLLRHQHEVHNLNSTTKATLFCPEPNCERHSGTGFTRRENLNDHIRRRHLLQPAFEGQQSPHMVKKPVEAGQVAVSIASASTSAGAPTAEKVQEIPTPQRWKFKVIYSRSCRKTEFFRSVSHRPMWSDEDLSESDDEMDDLWFREKYCDMIKEQGDLNDDEKEFMVRWAMHIMAEHFPHGRYVSDSMVRFVRNEKIWLRWPRVLLEWCKLIRELKEYGVVDDKVIKECYEILWSNDTAQAHCIHANSAPPFRSGDRDRDLPRGVYKGSVSKRGQKMVQAGSCGVCARTNIRKSEAIACNETACKTPGVLYHLGCVREEKRSDGWMCATCLSGKPGNEVQTIHSDIYRDPPSPEDLPPPKRPRRGSKCAEWTIEEEAEVIRRRNRGENWATISSYIPFRSAWSCGQRYRKYLMASQ